MDITEYVTMEAGHFGGGHFKGGLGIGVCVGME